MRRPRLTQTVIRRSCVKINNRMTNLFYKSDTEREEIAGRVRENNRSIERICDVFNKNCEWQAIEMYLTIVFASAHCIGAFSTVTKWRNDVAMVCLSIWHERIQNWEMKFNKVKDRWLHLHFIVALADGDYRAQVRCLCKMCRTASGSVGFTRSCVWCCARS